MLVLFGGYSDNTHFDDTWQFNITTARWRQRTQFVYPIFPDTCTDDFEFIEVRTTILQLHVQLVTDCC
jgi:Galactose oxidase, central domain